MRKTTNKNRQKTGRPETIAIGKTSSIQKCILTQFDMLGCASIATSCARVPLEMSEKSAIVPVCARGVIKQRRREGEQQKQALLGFEPRFQESKSCVLTTAL